MKRPRARAPTRMEGTTGDQCIGSESAGQRCRILRSVCGTDETGTEAAENRAAPSGGPNDRYGAARELLLSWYGGDESTPAPGIVSLAADRDTHVRHPRTQLNPAARRAGRTTGDRREPSPVTTQPPPIPYKITQQQNIWHRRAPIHVKKDRVKSITQTTSHRVEHMGSKYHRPRRMRKNHPSAHAQK